MEWWDDPRGGGGVGKLGLLSHFLTALGLKENNARDRAPHFNAVLAQHGGDLALEQVKLPNRDGKPPWVGTKACFRAIYKTL